MKSAVGELTPLAAPLAGVARITPPSTKPSYITIPPLLCSTLHPFDPIKVHNFHLKSQYSRPIILPRKFLRLAAASSNQSNNGDDNNDKLSKDEGGVEENGSKNNGDRVDGNGGNGNGNEKGNERPRLNFKWVDLLLDPDPDNIVAVGLTGVLAWASVQVLWQLFVISTAIVLAALKYSFVAALLIFILITLL